MTKQRCPQCNGSGQITTQQVIKCTYCAGKGNNCYYCNNKGYLVKYETITCPPCQGTGWVNV